MNNIQYSKCTTENLRAYFKEHAVPKEKMVAEKTKLHIYKICAIAVEIIVGGLLFFGFSQDFIHVAKLRPVDLRQFGAVIILLFEYLVTLFLLWLAMEGIIRPIFAPYTVKQENLVIYEQCVFKRYGKFLDFQDVLKTKQIGRLDINEYFLLVEYKENDLIINSVKITLTENLKKCGFVTENGLDFTWLDEKIQKDLCAWGLGSMHF